MTYKVCWKGLKSTEDEARAFAIDRCIDFKEMGGFQRGLIAIHNWGENYQYGYSSAGYFLAQNGIAGEIRMKRETGVEWDQKEVERRMEKGKEPLEVIAELDRKGFVPMKVSSVSSDGIVSSVPDKEVVVPLEYYLLKFGAFQNLQEKRAKRFVDYKNLIKPDKRVILPWYRD